jgi:hypothetical protein
MNFGVTSLAAPNAASSGRTRQPPAALTNGCCRTHDAVAVAAVEPGFGAKPPNCVLNEPREIRREAGVEAARIDLAGDALDDSGATVWRVAAGAVEVVGVQFAKDAGTVQEIVHQGIDGDHHRAGVDPGLPLGVTREQQLEQRHRQHLVGHTIDVPQGLE